jgi:putative protease
MITLTEPVKRARNEALHQELSQYIENEPKERIRGKLTLKKGQPATLTVSKDNTGISVTGAIVEAAQKQPMDEERIQKQINKTGNTSFAFDEIEIEMDDNIFVPIQSMNELRRNAIDELQEQLLKVQTREASVPYETKPGKKREKTASNAKRVEHNITAYIEKEEYFEPLLKVANLAAIYLDINMINKPIEKYIQKCHEANKECMLVLPHIFRSAKNETKEYYESVIVKDLDGIVVKNHEEYMYLKKMGFSKKIVLDANVYTFNEASHDFWQSRQITMDTAPVELNYKELLERGLEQSELIVYGHLPMMVSAQCIHKTIEGCDKKSTELYLKDRMNKDFFVRNNCKFCYNTIYNCQPLVLLDNVEEIDALAPMSLRLNFTIEDSKEVACIAQKYIDCFIHHKPITNTFNDFTRGHFKRGIE